jgi:hypothetical protein
MLSPANQHGLRNQLSALGLADPSEQPSEQEPALDFAEFCQDLAND